MIIYICNVDRQGIVAGIIEQPRSAIFCALRIVDLFLLDRPQQRFQLSG
jgi:hypothetical protein